MDKGLINWILGCCSVEIIRWKRKKYKWFRIKLRIRMKVIWWIVKKNHQRIIIIFWLTKIRECHWISANRIWIIPYKISKIQSRNLIGPPNVISKKLNKINHIMEATLMRSNTIYRLVRNMHLIIQGRWRNQTGKWKSINRK